MAILNTNVEPSFGNPQGKKIAAMLAGASLIAYLAIIGVKKEEKIRAIPAAAPRTYKSTDALSVPNRPAKNANMKGSLPSASKWV